MGVRIPVLIPVIEDKYRKIGRSGSSRVLSTPEAWRPPGDKARAIVLRQYLIYTPAEFDDEPRRMLVDIALSAIEALAAVETDEGVRKEIAGVYVHLKKIEDLYFVED